MPGWPIPAKRARLQAVRFEAVKRLADLARERDAVFVLVAGDLFDSPSPERSVVSQACAAIGGFGIPVHVIPGNHDFGGPGSLWEQDFFQREKDDLAPNLHLHLEAQPVDIGPAVLLPCPLVRRHQSADSTAWLQQGEVLEALPRDKPRIVLAHGTLQDFGARDLDDEEDGGALNQLDLDRLPWAELDYAALGDWHGTRQVQERAWYRARRRRIVFPRGQTMIPAMPWWLKSPEPNRREWRW